MNRGPASGGIETADDVVRGQDERFERAYATNNPGELAPLDTRQMEEADRSLEEDARESLLALIDFHLAIERAAEGFVNLTVSFSMPRETGKPVAGSYTFLAVPETSLIKEFIERGVTASNISPDRLSIFGIEASACRFADMQDDVQEWRLYLKRIETGETYVVTSSETDHWQESHSHTSFFERYIPYEGTVVLIAATDTPGVFAVHVLRKTPHGYREVSFVYDAAKEVVRGALTVMTYADGETVPGVDVITNAPHNVYLSHDAVIGTAKGSKDAAIVEDDRRPEPAFDQTLKQHARSGRPVHELILEEVGRLMEA